MRKGMTLIELIFAMVIISIVFSVVPKIIYVSNKSMALSMKEDALFNAYTLMGSITKLSWDENTLTDGKILDTDAASEMITPRTDCNNTRIGGFSGSRNCIGSSDSASDIGLEVGTTDYNDIDDYDAYNEDVNVSGKNRYKITVDVNYVKDDYDDVTTGTSELKEIKVTVASHEDNKRMTNTRTNTKFESSFFYHSANLGHIQIKKELW